MPEKADAPRVARLVTEEPTAVAAMSEDISIFATVAVAAVGDVNEDEILALDLGIETVVVNIAP